MKIVKAPFKWFISGFSGKTSWEWLELLIVPAGLAIGAFYLESQAERRQEEIATTRYEQEAQIADVRAKQETLDNYLEKMQELLLNRNLRNADEASEVRSVARAITTTAIREMGSDRNALLVNFLQESNLIQKPENTEENTGASLLSLFIGINLTETNLDSVNLKDANMRNASLRGANLYGANLNNANLIFADMEGADLRDIYLRNATMSNTRLRYSNLEEADMRSADMRSAILRSANLSKANLGSADLREATLLRADLSNADFGYVDLRGASLHSADLGGTNLRGANLENTDLRSANLTDVQNATKEQLSKARLCNTKLPEGIALDSDRDCERLKL